MGPEFGPLPSSFLLVWALTYGPLFGKWYLMGAMGILRAHGLDCRVIGLIAF